MDLTLLNSTPPSISSQYNNAKTTTIQYPIQILPSKAAFQKKLLSESDGESILYAGIFIMTCLVLIPLLVACICCIRRRFCRSYHDRSLFFMQQQEVPVDFDARVRRRANSLIQQHLRSPVESSSSALALSPLVHQLQPVFLNTSDGNSESRISLKSMYAINSEANEVQQTTSCSTKLPQEGSSSTLATGDIYHCKYDSPFCERLQAVLVRESSLN